MQSTTWRTIVVGLALALIWVAVPHTLEDFALGEPARNGVPAPVLATVIATVLVAQGLALYGLGRGQRAAYWLQAGLGIFWAVTAGAAQLPTLLTAPVYRSGLLSKAYVLGMVLVGLLVSLAAFQASRRLPAEGPRS